MTAHLSAIYQFVQSQVDQGKVIDVDKCCQQFLAQFPELTRKQIENEVIKAVCEYGGGAGWGQDKAERSRAPER